MRHLIATTTAILISVLTLSGAAARAATSPDILLNSGLYLSGIDQKPVLKITTDESGRSVQIEGPRIPQATLSLNSNHNFDTTSALESGPVTAEFIRKCSAKAGQEKPCFKGLYDTASGKLRLQAGDEYNVTARLLVLSSDSVLQMQWTTWTRDDSMIAQKFTKQVLTLAPRTKTNVLGDFGNAPAAPAKDPVSL